MGTKKLLVIVKWLDQMEDMGLLNSKTRAMWDLEP